MSETDEVLMLAVRDDDIAKLGTLFDRHHGILLDYLVRMTRNRAAAEDLVQEVFLRILKYRRTFHDNSRFLAWMFRIARNVRIDLYNGGNIVVDGVEGEIEVTNLSGGVTLNKISGSAVVHSMNGTVLASFRQVSGNKPMALTSMNGNIDVTLPADVKANLKMRTDLGDIYSDFDIQLRASPASSAFPPPPPSPPPTFSTLRDHDPHRFPFGGSISGTINNGGPDFDLRTFNGNIYIRKAKQ